MSRDRFSTGPLTSTRFPLDECDLIMRGDCPQFLDLAVRHAADRQMVVGDKTRPLNDALGRQ
jgi:hypothetical protein